MSENELAVKPSELSILVVDDMKSMRLTIRKMLKSLGIGKKLQFAENGKAGLQILRGSKCDLAIIDWNMPVMNGIAMLEEIRNDPALRDMPVIMVTAEAERDIVLEVAETEVEGYLLKPLTLESLDSKIKTVIQQLENPDPVTVHRKRARDLEEAGDYSGAIQETKLALQLKPSASRLLRQLGLLNFRIKKNQIAEKCLLKAVSVNPQDTKSRVFLADYYLKINELEKTGRHYLHVLSLSTQYNDRAFDIGSRLLRNGHKSLALQIFTKVIAKSSKRNAAREKIIDICLQYHELDFPRQLLKDAIRDNPSNYDMVFKAGTIEQDAGDWESALKLFKKVDRNVRGHIDAKLRIAKIYYMNRKILVADDYLNQILRIDPTHEEAIALRREI